MGGGGEGGQGGSGLPITSLSTLLSGVIRDPLENVGL